MLLTLVNEILAMSTKFSTNKHNYLQSIKNKTLLRIKNRKNNFICFKLKKYLFLFKFCFYNLTINEAKLYIF